MPSKQLQSLLEALHQELQAAPSLDNETAAKLRQLGNDIENALAGKRDAGLQKRVGDALEHFEGEHPKLTDLLNRIASTLSSLGI